MDFMFAKLIWFVLFAFLLGATVGWFACSTQENNED